MKRPICFLALVAILFACEEGLRFEQAQPADAKALNKIPSSLRGEYIDEDSVHLNIGKRAVVESHFLELDTPLDSIAMELEKDEDWVLTDSTEYGFTVYSEEEDVRLKVHTDRSTNTGSIEYEETLFKLSETQVLKQFNDAYYFSVLKKNDQAWILRRVTIQGDSLFFEKIDEPSEFEELDALTPVRDHFEKDGEKEGWQINPTPEVLEYLFQKYGERTKSFKKLK